MTSLRRKFLGTAAAMAVLFLAGEASFVQPGVNPGRSKSKEEHQVHDIGGRLELLVDHYLIESMTGDVQLQLHRPERKEIVFRTDAPWEGNASAYQSVFQDGNLYRMYYRGSHFGQNPTESGPLAKALKPHPSYLCYAESLDGIHWRRPELDLYEFPRHDSNGFAANNIVLHPDTPGLNVGPSGAAVFFDDNPDCPSDERYKIIGVGDRAGRGLYVMKSADGIHFSPLSDRPIVTEGAFDSQNIVFWDPIIKAYREYHRIHLPGGVPGVATSTSKDILRFPSPEEVNFPGAPIEGLYMPLVKPYYRAPHILVGFPTRYTEREWSGPLLALPGLEERLARANSYPPSRPPLRFGRVITDALFMTSRDGANFKRWPEAFIRPGPRRRESWVYGDNFVFWGMVETRSHLEDAPDEISLYATEGYWEGTDTAVRRYTVRIDGFVSAAASAAGGELVTKPLLFEGGNLTINFETSGASGVRVEVQEADGRPFEGYTLDDCPEMFADSIRYKVRWNHGGDVRPLRGKPVRLRFVMRDADLYSFQFVPFQPDLIRHLPAEPFDAEGWFLDPDRAKVQR